MSQQEPRQQGRLASLDALRALAAFAVMIGHYRSLVFEDYSSSAPWFAKLIYFATGFGHQAVIVFFVLSGFFVGGGVLRVLRDDRWSFRHYASRRLARLYTVLIPTLALTWLLDEIGMSYARTAPLYAGAVPNHLITSDVMSRHSFTLLLGNALYLEGLVVPTFGTDTALWSLAYEFWFYLLFPALCLACGPGRSSLERAVYAALALAITWLLWGEPLGFFLIWVLGAAVSWALQSDVMRSGLARSLRFPSLALFAIVLAATRFIPDSRMDFVLGLSVAPLVATTAVADWRWPEVLRRGVTFSADISYTLYAAHLPIIALIVAATFSTRQPFNATSLAIALAHIATVLVAISVLWWAFERRTDRVRLSLDRWLTRSTNEGS